MMVGKRERDCKNPMRRTTSMTEFAPPDALAAVMEDEEGPQLSDDSSRDGGQQDWLSALGGGGGGVGGAAAQEDWLAAYHARAAPARAGLRRNSADYSAVETAAFLRACGLCRRRLGPGRDTFMYKYVSARSPPAPQQDSLFFVPRHLPSRYVVCLQGRGGVLQPGVQGAAHDAGGVEGQVRGDVDQGRCRGLGQGQGPPRRLRQGWGHGGRSMTTMLIC
uniref:FLZ-type domain-containing protein n=1 Tax=Zea mays TaxID=4577 RepID=B4G0H9_MAIZE|nr:unknown [Zea mays]